MIIDLYLRRLRLLPWPIIALMTFISAIGALILYSAAEGHVFPWAGKQIGRFCIGLLLMLFIACTDLRLWNTIAYPSYALSLIFLIAVEAMGVVGMGAQRWLDLYIFNLQPSEPMKIALIMALARYFHHCTQEDIFKISTLIAPACMILCPALLMMRQPDLGTAVVLILCGSSLFFVAGVRIWLFLVVISGVGASMPILWTLLRDYQKNRVLIFLNPELDPLHKGYHIMQSKIALGSGGLWGKGFMQGTQSHLNFLPEKQTDFIFTMLCEEFGLIGGIFILALYSLLLIYGFTVAIRSHHSFGRFLALGLTSMLFWYIFINMAMVIGLLPVVGVPLPLLSYGGTAMLTLMIGMGMIFSVAVHHDVRLGRN